MLVLVRRIGLWLTFALVPGLLLGHAHVPGSGAVNRCGETGPALSEAPTLYQYWSLLFAGVVTLSSEPAPPQDRYILIDLASKRLTFYRNGRAVAVYPVGIGTEQDPSPVGEWRVIQRDRDWGGGFGSRWLGLNVPWGIYGIHGTNQPWSVGGRVSHGCFRLSNDNVKQLYPQVPLGTPVVVLGPPLQYRPYDTLRLGQSAKMLVVLQKRLRAAGWSVGFADGRYRAKTEQAVRNLEAFYGLPQDGIARPDEQWLVQFR